MENLDINNYLFKDNGKELLWIDIINFSSNYENLIEKDIRKKTGSYYTSFDLTKLMVDDIISLLLKDNNDPKKIISKTFLEPCVGTGNFIFTFLYKIYTFNFSKEENLKILNNIYVCDINLEALNIYKHLLSLFSEVYFGISLSNRYFEEHIGRGLLFDLGADKVNYIDISSIFSKDILKDGFDIVITNPPYKNLKAEKTHYKNEKELALDKERYSDISKFSKTLFKYSNDGVLNIYKLFVEEILAKYTNEEAIVSLLIPSSFLTDKSCGKIRKFVLCENKIDSIRFISESSNYIDVSQSMITILIEKNKKTDDIMITPDLYIAPENRILINVEKILNESSNNAIFMLKEDEYSLLDNIRNFKTIKDLDFIVNMRGELDLTNNKSYVTESETDFPLIRGKNIDYYFLKNIDNQEFVKDEFLKLSNKYSYIVKDRIICQQIANIHKKRRVTFAKIEGNYILGNSCNFISVLENDYGIDIYYLLGLLNSSIIDWYFKLISSNNHINNYEVDMFPIPLNKNFINNISTLTKDFIETKNSLLLSEIDLLVKNEFMLSLDTTQKSELSYSNVYSDFFNDLSTIIFNISFEEAVDLLDNNIDIETFLLMNGRNFNDFTTKVIKSIYKKYIKIKNKEILNHTTFKLSDLDMEMIKSVPQGGNWKNIPEEIIKKSKRLVGISKSGGRTTLYGRIDYTKPSYTITTYFNRPGNGTYIHPNIDRVLSVREAARFQSFKDNFYFYGNKTQLLKQVGNAVPPLMAYNIGNNLLNILNISKSIDLFCGAGGMTEGFKEAGIKAILANDIEESACISLKINNPKIEVLCADITEKNTKEMIINTALENDVDLICGGPPCQGFSTAGLRLIDDPRNNLFKEFVEIVERVKPKAVVFENVEGLLSYQGGEVYRSILELFSEYGYFTEGRKLLASHYGVPQKRKRVIIICIRKDLNIHPKEIFPIPILEESSFVSAFTAISDLESVLCSDNAKYQQSNDSEYVKALKSKNGFSDFMHGLMPKKILSKKNNDKKENIIQLSLGF